MSSLPRAYTTTSASLILSLLLTACGGGGGGGGGTPSTTVPTTLTPISQANYQAASAEGVAPIGELLNVTSATGMLVTGVEIQSSRTSLAEVTSGLVKRFRTNNLPVVTGVIYTESCSGGGTVTLDATSASTTQFTAGDRATLTANNCRESGFPTVNGVLSFTITAVSGDPINSNTYSLGIAATFNNFTMTEGSDRVAVQGDMTMTASQNGTNTVNSSISGQSLSMVMSISGTTTDSHQISAYNLSGTDSGTASTLTGRYNLAGSSASLGGSYAYNVEILQPLVISRSSDFPSSGSVIVRGSPSTVTLTALNSTSVRIDYSSAGDGVVTSTNTLSWNQFDALN